MVISTSTHAKTLSRPHHFWSSGVLVPLTLFFWNALYCVPGSTPHPSVFSSYFFASTVCFVNIFYSPPPHFLLNPLLSVLIPMALNNFMQMTVRFPPPVLTSPLTLCPPSFCIFSLGFPKGSWTQPYPTQPIIPQLPSTPHQPGPFPVFAILVNGSTSYTS